MNTRIGSSRHGDNITSYNDLRFAFESLMVSKSAEIGRFLCICSTFSALVLTVWSRLRAGNLAA
ncbi:hypothetical protein L195_g049927 [Trifolium pratense]|uniref:Uncharacterized protein n=1 Tax=Trifolium pratense TaxID=57577 RepID=A0A2K3JRA2_TRIPR|nr:hypothetical protein L195_g049927 [Trifolium pratense]